MSKKMWHKIFKSKSQKQQQQLNKINKRHSRGIYEEYQQLNDLLNGEKSQASRFSSENENGNINVFEQQPQQSSFNSSALSEAQQQQQQQLLPVQQQQQQQRQQQSQQLSTFSRVRNTFSLRRNNSNNNSNKKQTPNAKSSESATPTSVGVAQLQHVLIIVNQIDVGSTQASAATTTTNTTTNFANHLHANPAITLQSTTMECDGIEEDHAQAHADDDVLAPPPGPITTCTDLPAEYSDAQVELSPCPNCSRSFNIKSLARHINTCNKITKKRKPFDSSRQRREGTSLSTYVLPKNFGLPNAEKAVGVHTPPAASREASSVSNGSQEVASPLPDRRKSQGSSDKIRSTAKTSLRKAAAAAATPDNSQAAPQQQPTAVSASAPAPLARDRLRASRKEPASERCPHCERSFNLKAFDRHVEWCKEKAIQANIKTTNTQETNKAKERMEARKQYRPPNLKTKRSINRDKYSGSQEEQCETEMVSPKQNLMSLSMTSSVHSDNGFSPLAGDKYDPFLSAKRQLEELCSPNTPPDNEPVVQPTMSTSLTGTLGKLHNNTSTTTTTTPKTTTSSNFRRTSSLRGPRRTPLLPSRPLFATNYRPTIQRGLSDEGPISNNFLKPEEYDEMPVRAACVNDFHSPRVVRRDTSASNRKQQMKLPLSNATEQPNRNVAKTDSLAVFLKYEHELEQLNTKAAELAAANSKELSSKELKEKSNNLSKQNSAKNLTANGGQLPPLMTTPLCPPPTQQVAAAAKENNENMAHNYATPLRLEPITSSKPMTPLAPSGATMPIKLESIFSTYIDPKLINACDNLHVQQQQQSSTGSSDASSTPQQMPQSRSSSQSTITMGPEQRRHSGEARNLLKRKMRLGRNQFLYDASPEEAYISSGSCADDEGNRSSLEFDEQCWQQQQKQLFNNPILGMPKMPVLPTFDDFDFEEFLSSFENENDEEQLPLFRDCREFLLNRTTNRQRSSQKATSTPQPVHTKTETATQRPATAGSNFITPPKTTHFLTKASPSTHRSDSNASSSGGSFKTPANSSGSYKTAQNTTPLNSSDDNKSNHSSQIQKCEDESQKREIFISIETEANAQGRSPISPDSLRHMVGNAQTPIDVVHIDNGNEPEHAKFSKISDNEDQLDVEHDDELSRGRYTTQRLSSMPGTVPTNTSTSQSPNVEANNAKNVIEKFRNDFQQLGEQTGASVRREMQQMQQKQAQQELKVNSPLTPSPSGDSDELSSLDGYPMSRRGASSKLSSDSAYGSSNSPYSLSRQRSSELQTDNSPRTQSQLRPHTASGALAPVSGKMDVSTQAQTNHGTLKARQRMFAGNGLGGNTINDVHAEYSSSSSEHLAQQQQQQNTNYNYQQQQQQQSKVQVAYNNNNNNNYDDNAKNLSNNKNNNDKSVRCSLTPTTSQQSLVSNNSNGSTSGMSASMKMSKFCHECGGKFVIEHAKFCMECGVRRVVL